MQELICTEDLSEMDDGGVKTTPVEMGIVCSDSAYGSSVVDTDTEDGQTPTFSYNEDLTHKVMTFTLLLMRIVLNSVMVRVAQVFIPVVEEMNHF